MKPSYNRTNKYCTQSKQAYTITIACVF